MLPQIFEAPESIIWELTTIGQRAGQLLKTCETSKSVQDAFVLAYRLEFYLLHPTFETLFHTLHIMLPNHRNPEEDYESHIDRFIHALAQYGTVTPELEIVGEALQRLWRESRTLTHQASEDPLTGLLNMRAFLRSAKQLSYLAQRNKENLSIMMIDIDNFKQINDRYGHQQGNAVLRALAEMLQSNLRASDVVARYGGEEFIVLLFGTTKDSARFIAEKLRHLTEQATPGGIGITVSIGVAEGQIGSQVDEDLDALILSADQRMYAAKHAGKNRVGFCD
jgi:diguanylate cyclase (GGDEF)-like protein